MSDRFVFTVTDHVGTMVDVLASGTGGGDSSAVEHVLGLVKPDPNERFHRIRGAIDLLRN